MNCRAQSKPVICPSCKKRFEDNKARGVIQKLFFSFDASAKNQQVETTKELIAQMEALKKKHRDYVIEKEAREKSFIETMKKEKMSSHDKTQKIMG